MGAQPCVPLVPALRPLLSTPMKTSDTNLIVRTAACFDPTAQFLPRPPHALGKVILWDAEGYQLVVANVLGRWNIIALSTEARIEDKAEGG